MVILGVSSGVTVGVTSSAKADRCFSGDAVAEDASDGEEFTEGLTARLNERSRVKMTASDEGVDVEDGDVRDEL